MTDAAIAAKQWFGRTVDMRWYSSPLAPQEEPQYLSRIQYGFDRMSRRLWRQDLAAPATTRQDRFYGYDGLGHGKMPGIKIIDAIPLRNCFRAGNRSKSLKMSLLKR